MSAAGPVRLRIALLVLAVAARALPHAVRDRYAQEWRADLAVAPESALPYALSLLWRVASLRRAVTGTRSLRCRLNLHSDETVHDNPENRRFSSHVCRRCGRVKDDWKGPASPTDAWAWTAASGGMQ